MAKAVRIGGAKPLSAADVRAIIDEYAGRINENRAARAGGAQALQTSREIYSGVSETALESRAAVRESVNTRSVEHIVTEVDNSVNTMLDMLEFTGEGETVTMTRTQKGIAEEILKLGKKLSEDNLVELTTANVTLSVGSEETVVATFRMGNGNTFAVDTGLGRDDLLGQMGKVTGRKQTWETEKSRGASNINAGNDRKELLKDLEKTFELVSNEESIKQLTEQALLKVPTHSKKTHQPLPDKYRMAKARDLVRNRLTDVVEPLQMALSKARPHDVENVKLVNQVRDVLAGDKGIDTKDLLKRIKAALDTKIVDSSEKVARELESGNLEDISEMKDEDIAPLNINAWLERS